MPTKEFLEFAERGFNRVPVTRKLTADIDTPLSVYMKLANAKNSFLLESVHGGERFGRYSFIGLPAKIKIEVYGQDLKLMKSDEIIEAHKGDPLDYIKSFMKRFKVAPTGDDLPRFCGGLAGYFGYDTIRYIEPRLKNTNFLSKPLTPNVPDILLMLTEELVVFDNVAGNITLIVYADPKEKDAHKKATKKLDKLSLLLANPLVIDQTYATESEDVVRHFPKSEFLNSVVKAKKYIADGEVMQVVIGQSLTKPFKGSSLSLYRALRSINPSPYMYYYNVGDFQVVGASPEILVRQDKDESSEQKNNKVTIRPIAGTRPRGKDEEEDLQNENELIGDPKECAEHVMLIDLARNDIGRIAEPGSVNLTEKMIIEKYSHVMHLVSQVEGKLKPDLSFIDVLRATFPAGTLSGAPKIRAMEIIDELEPQRRGVYGGACGYLSFTGEMDLAITIRTGVLKDGFLTVQAGAGIVADSVPEKEWLESEHKAMAVLRAAEMVERNVQ
ncbi:MAG: anthranilate synthase component I [Betaproteobacteria bacterium TMED156]|nr:MAG: anthranilate synthase component I [Betaproteobacteria bacterium TMED156]